jgi:hypothetical protein
MDPCQGSALDLLGTWVIPRPLTRNETLVTALEDLTIIILTIKLIYFFVLIIRLVG